MIVQEAAYLEHVGVKGMHWGVRKAATDGPTNRQLNKASRAKDRIASDKAIDKARARTEGTTRAAKLGLSDAGSKSHTDYKKARAQYKVDKQTMGSREARKVLAKARDKRMADIETSNLTKSGKETTIAVLGTIGLVGLAVLSSGGSSR